MSRSSILNFTTSYRYFSLLLCSWGDFKEGYVTRIAVLGQFCAKVITQCLYKVPLESYEERIQQISARITNHNEWWVIFADIALIKNLKKLSHCVTLAWHWHCHLILNMLFPFWKLFISSFNFLLWSATRKVNAYVFLCRILLKFGILRVSLN